MTVVAAIPESLRQLRLVREFDAPRALVWKMWTDPAHVAAWWGPEHFTTPVVKMDVTPGGAIHMVMRGPDGADFPFDGRFVAVEEPDRLVMRTWVRREADRPGSRSSRASTLRTSTAGPVCALRRW